MFQPGVNLLVGEKDSGKTKWLSMLDYLFGSPDKPEDAFGEDLANKYEAASAEIEINGERMIIERRWKGQGKTKVRVNDVTFSAPDFSEFLLQKLNIPQVSFPKGNPWAERGWVTLSWRMLLRHVYRQERFWTDFADKQPPQEQHACISQFLGAAISLFPQKWGELIEKQKQLEALQARKEAHVSLLNSITAELVHHSEMTVGVTEASLSDAESRLKGQLAELEGRRKRLLDDVKEQIKTKVDAQAGIRQQALNELRTQRDSKIQERAKLLKREVEIAAYEKVLQTEVERLARAKASGQAFADLRVTHCPACDQELNHRPSEPGACFLCHQSLPTVGPSGGSNRIDFEVDQLKEESDEIGELLAKLRSEIAKIDESLRFVTEAAARLEVDLAAARSVAATLIPQDLVLIDQDAGRLNEQISFLGRIRKTLDQQKELAAQIKSLEEDEVRLKNELESATPEVNLDELSATFQERMVEYLNKINADDSRRWQYGPINFRLRSRDFQIKVKDGKWNSQIGATSQALVLFAYHYALLSLVGDGHFNYPGLVIVDFPLELADGASIADKENYLVEPFVELCSRRGMEKTQFIAAGRAFVNLEGAHQITLSR